MSEKVIKIPFKGRITAKQLFSELLDDDSIEEAVVIIKRKDEDGDPSFSCESTSITIIDLAMAEKTLSATCTLAVISEMDKE